MLVACSHYNFLPILSGVTLLLAGCSLLPKIPINATFNDPTPIHATSQDLNQATPEHTGSTTPVKATKATTQGWMTIATTGKNRYAMQNVFVGVAISGGGTRAANFGAAVLYELEQQGILDQVSAISSVSGGSLANGYYALFGSFLDNSPNNNVISSQEFQVLRAEFWKSFREAMATDFRSQWLSRYLAPWNIASTSFTHKDRTDILAETFDSTLFQGKTFGDLPHFGPLSPKILINATLLNSPRLAFDALSSRGADSYSSQLSGFTFADDSFSSIGSRLDTFNISRAVAASAAFPGVFNASTLRTYGPVFKDNVQSGVRAEGYLHLIDGGPSDNLGTDALVNSVREFEFKFAGSEAAPSRGCLLIIVDASASQTADPALRSRPDARGFVSHFIDLDFIEASDALLQRRREDALQELGVPPVKLGERGMRFFDSQLPGFANRRIRVSNRFNSDVGIPLGLRSSVNQGSSGRAVTSEADIQKADSRETRCAIWRISIDDVVTAGAPSPREQERDHEFYARSKAYAALPESRTRRRVWEIASRIRTDFDLVGPEGCSKSELQTALWDAARIVVRDDFESRSEVCKWMEKHGIFPFKTCAKTPTEPLVWPVDTSAAPSPKESIVPANFPSPCKGLAAN